jgi:hypothetical protein
MNHRAIFTFIILDNDYRDERNGTDKLLKIGLTQGLNLKRQKAATRETSEFSIILRQCLA